MIDAHIHLNGSDLYPGTLEEGDRLGIKLFVCSAVTNIGYYPDYDTITKANDDLIAVMRREQGKVTGYCYVNPRHGEQALMDFRRRIEDQGMIGLKLWVSTLCDDPLVYPFVEQAIEYRAPILIHAWRKTVGQMPYETTADHVANLAERYPEARILMAHMSGQVESSMNMIEPYKNVFTDTSGTPIGGAEVATAVQRLGAERVIFGSDLYGADLASNIGKVMGAGLPSEQFEKVMGGNMERLLAEVVK